MKSIKANELSESVIDLIGKEWMLVSAADERGFNTMTASWGMVGYMFNRNVVMIVVRPERYTHTFIENSERFTLSILESGEQNRKALMHLGKVSGRDCDKVAEAGLHPMQTQGGNPTFEEARIVIECRKIYSQMMSDESFIDKSILEKWYGDGHGNLHHIYIAEIESVLVKE